MKTIAPTMINPARNIFSCRSGLMALESLPKILPALPRVSNGPAPDSVVRL
jgi:hypothetical protein